MIGPELGAPALALRGGGGPALLLDFVAGLYRRGAETQATFTALSGASFARTGAGTALTVGGATASFATGAPRVTDRGLLLEGAATNLAYPSTTPATWPIVNNVSSAVAAQTYPPFTPTTLGSTGNAGGYIATINQIPYTLGTLFYVSIWWEPGTNAGKLFVQMPGGTTAIATRSAAGVWSFSQSTTGFALVSDAPVGFGDVRRTVLALTSPISAGGRIAVGPFSSVNGETVLIHGAQVETGGPSSLIVTTTAAATRGADSASVTAPAGVATWTAVYGAGNTVATGAVTPGATFDLVAGRPWVGLGNELRRLTMQ